MTYSFAVILEEDELDEFLSMMERLQCSTPSKLLRIALGTQARLSDINLPAKCFDAGRLSRGVIKARKRVS